MKKLIHNLYNKCLFRYYKVSIGKNFNCEGRLIIQGHGIYKIGDNVKIISKKELNPVGGDQTVLQTLNGGKITIGTGSGISHAILCSSSEICIEDNVLIGGCVKMYDTDFHSIKYEQRIQKPDLNVKTRPIKICEGAFIGAHSIILKGVTIGKRSIVGAGSVVSKDIPDNEIWGGNPARFIRKVVS